MIFWSRGGILVLVVLVLAFMLMGFLFDTITGIDDYTDGHGLPDVLAFALSGVICWFMGRALNKPKGKVYIDPETGNQVVFSKTHTLFFIKVEYWGIILLVIAFINIFTCQQL
ncbi:hypothetical protein [Abyssisolibacter fermentans]|uniref:hypothetical protein n=1 Tax=Abyssisolibacter fermentans TaxID=1766203 RepID=UPI0008329C22|nr:hypothetical protein [Abyssisolibacter fermentans]